MAFVFWGTYPLGFLISNGYNYKFHIVTRTFIRYYIKLSEIQRILYVENQIFYWLVFTYFNLKKYYFSSI